MIILTEYLTYAEVRAVLGLSIYELPDETLELALYTRALRKKLQGITGTVGAITGTLVTIFDGLSNLLEPTAEEEDMLDLIKQISVYTVAEACLESLPLIALKSETDGKSTQVRALDANTFKALQDQIRIKLQGLVTEATVAVGGTTGSYPWVTRVAPLTDVVTG